MLTLYASLASMNVVDLSLLCLWRNISDVNDIKYVINFDCPKNVEDYIHRIGRTARHDKTVCFTLTF